MKARKINKRDLTSIKLGSRVILLKDYLGVKMGTKREITKIYFDKENGYKFGDFLGVFPKNLLKKI